MKCTKCGLELLKAERGNIRQSDPSGFEHTDCSKALELPVVDATPVEPDVSPEANEVFYEYGDQEGEDE